MPASAADADSSPTKAFSSHLQQNEITDVTGPLEPETQAALAKALAMIVKAAEAEYGSAERPKACARSKQPLEKVQAPDALQTALKSATPSLHTPATALMVREDTAKHYSPPSPGIAEASASAPKQATQQATSTAAGEETALTTLPKLTEAQPTSVEDMASKINLKLNAQH